MIPVYMLGQGIYKHDSMASEECSDDWVYHQKILKPPLLSKACF